MTATRGIGARRRRARQRRPRGAPYHLGYFAAFALDPEGNNIEAVHHGRGRRSAASVVVEID